MLFLLFCTTFVVTMLRRSIRLACLCFFWLLPCEHSLHLYFGANHRMLRKNRIFNMNKIQIKQKKRNIYIKYFLVIECGRESAHIHNPHFEIFISLYRNFCFCFSLFLVSLPVDLGWAREKEWEIERPWDAGLLCVLIQAIFAMWKVWVYGPSLYGAFSFTTPFLRMPNKIVPCATLIQNMANKEHITLRNTEEKYAQPRKTMVAAAGKKIIE